MKQKFFQAGNDWTGFVARTSLGLLILPHGLQKAFGLFGGYGFTGTMQYFTDYIRIPWILGAFIIFAEVVGALSLIAGLATRFWSVVIIALMLGTIITVHGKFGIFMDWGANMPGEGYEYHLSIIVLGILLILNGAGKFSIDKKIASLPAGR
jgi:putative oxidoreductase